MAIGRDTTPLYSWKMYSMMIAAGFTSFLFSICMVVGLKNISATVSAVLTYLAIPFSFLLDFLFLGSLVSRLEIIGAAVIVATNITLAILRGSKVVD
jgi:drug/metabolite transporter (DMT)-like permease